MNSNKHIVILGAGESGVGAALLAKAKGFAVFVSDKGTIKEKYKKELNENNIEWEEGHHTQKKLDEAAIIIKSPGIPNSIPLIKQLKQAEKEIIGEIEFASRFTTAKLIGITGSNGKTTTSLLTQHILKQGGLNVGLGGNIGTSFARQVIQDEYDYYVLELSSFQLEDMYNCKLHIAVLLNIVPDHLDRYDYSMELYGAAKMRILQNQSQADYFIYNGDDKEIEAQLKKHLTSAQLIPFSITKKEGMAGYLENEQLTITIKNTLTMSIHELALKGKHNAQNSLVSGLAGRIVGIRKESIRESLADFTNVEHRLEFVAKVNGIEFINDSKATNINAAWFALESMDKPTVWIVGGVDKGNDYDELKSLVDEKVKAIICLGKDNEKIIAAFEDVVERIVEANSALEAVAYGYQLAKKDETVLLSPACASFDLFENYEDRGNQFKQAVRSL